jgi:alpha-mannosidase
MQKTHLAGIVCALVLGLLCVAGPARAAGAGRACDPRQDDTLYTIGYAHLDTQWRWTFQDSIYYFIVDTMRDNFALFEKYPGYTFNFTGSKRYIMMKEYYPADYEKVKEYVAKGRWIVSGSSVDENDANVPSTESLVRNVLYGNLYFKDEFGKISEDYMLPDCFGFPAFMPSVLAHTGVKGFSTQKLTWRSAVGIPFNVGKWIGPDGRSVVGALNPGAYVSKLRNDLSYDKDWLARTQAMGKQTGFFADFKYFGTGDRGGAPDDESASWMQKSLDSDGPLCVRAAGSDDIFQDVKETEIDKMTTHTGDMLLIEHSAGSLTSQAYVKRWNRKTELLADDAERASLMADWLGAIPYPTLQLREVWYLLLGTQMHDILPGTSIPKAYEFSWNDAVLTLNSAASIVVSAVGAAAAQLDTNVTGQPVVVYNPLSADREDLVRATVQFGDKTPAAVQVFDAGGAEVPSQIVKTDGGKLDVLFAAKVPSVGLAVFDVRAADKAPSFSTGLSVTDKTLENNRFRVTVNENGDVGSVFDKTANKEVLSAPAGLEFMADSPKAYPAWNIDWDDWKEPARAVVKGPAKVRIVENGPVRVALEVTRVMEGSTFVQTISLAAGDPGNRIEFDNAIDWRTQGTTLKAAFPLSVARDRASYNLELGVVERTNNHETKYEVPHHQWFDLTDENGSYGVSILEDSKFASDKPADNLVRLTLIRTPGCQSYCDQATQDLGRHRILFAMAPHQGDWRDGGSHWQAMRVNQPLAAFTATKHSGKLGKSFSFLKVNTSQVAVRAAKKAEESDWTIIRLQELNGKPAPGTTIAFAAPITAAKEVDGQEREIGKATIKDGALVVDMEPFIMRAFAVKIGAPAAPVARPVSAPVALDYNVIGSTKDDEKSDTGFDGIGHSFSADLLPQALTVDGIDFKLAPGGADNKSAVICKGQKLALPKGKFSKLYLLAVATENDVTGTFKAGDKDTTFGIQKWNGYIGQWDNRIWKNEREIFGLRPAFTRRDSVAWFASHLHNRYGTNIAYNYTYLFKYAINLPENATEVILPDDERIRIFAATAVSGPVDTVAPAQLLYDDFDVPEDHPVLSPAEGKYNDSTFVSIHYPWYSSYDEIRYNTDESDLTHKSPLYRSPILVKDRTVIQARAYGAGGRAGLLTIGKYEIDDITPPGVNSVEAYDLAPTAMVRLSEPVEKTSAENPANYTVAPDLAVKSASLAADNISVKLTLSANPVIDKTYTLTVNGLRDMSQNSNLLKAPAAVEFNAMGPVYNLKIRTKDINYSLGVPGISSDFSLVGKPTAANGLFGLALRLKGDGDCIVINDRPDLNPTSAITIAAWVNARDWDSSRRILQKGNEDNQYRLLADNGELLFALAGVGEVRGPLPPAREWRHVAATYDGSTMRLYVDGKLTAEQPAGGAISISGSALHIGAKHKDSAAGDFFMGDMDKIMIWSAALPPEHIAVLAARDTE